MDKPVTRSKPENVPVKTMLGMKIIVIYMYFEIASVSESDHIRFFQSPNVIVLCSTRYTAVQTKNNMRTTSSHCIICEKFPL